MAPTLSFEPSSIIRSVIASVLIYLYVVALLRVSGNRTLSKFRAFDFVVTIAIGSIVASTTVSQTTSLPQGAAAVTTLAAMQWITARASARWHRFNRLVTARPVLLYHDGAYLADAMRSARVTEDETLNAVRSAGLTRLSEVWLMVLEPDGDISVIERSARAPPGQHGGEALRPVPGASDFEPGA